MLFYTILKKFKKVTKKLRSNRIFLKNKKIKKFYYTKKIKFYIFNITL